MANLLAELSSYFPAARAPEQGSGHLLDQHEQLEQLNLQRIRDSLKVVDGDVCQRRSEGLKHDEPTLSAPPYGKRIRQSSTPPDPNNDICAAAL